MIYLKYSRPGSQEKDFATATRTVSIGTGITNTIQLDGPAILAKHAEIDSQSLRITTNAIPVNVNGEQIQDHTLENGDIITIGNWTLRFFHTAEENYINERDTRTMKVGSIHTHVATPPTARKQ